MEHIFIQSVSSGQCKSAEHSGRQLGGRFNISGKQLHVYAPPLVLEHSECGPQGELIHGSRNAAFAIASSKYINKNEGYFKELAVEFFYEDKMMIKQNEEKY